MKLYGYFRSSTSYRLRLALELKGLDYENCPVNLLESEQKGEPFTSRNPFATVPMLEAGGKDRVQSMAIIEWLDEAYPENPLLPVDLDQPFDCRIGAAVDVALRDLFDPVRSRWHDGPLLHELDHTISGHGGLTQDEMIKSARSFAIRFSSRINIQPCG